MSSLNCSSFAFAVVDQIFTALQVVPAGWVRGSGTHNKRQTNPYRVVWKVYKPITKIKKSDPPEPDFRISVIKYVPRRTKTLQILIFYTFIWQRKRTGNSRLVRFRKHLCGIAIPCRRNSHTLRQDTRTFRQQQAAGGSQRSLE